MYDALDEISERYADIDAARLYPGRRRVLGFLLPMDAEQGVEAVELFDAETAIPIHHDDYDVFESSLEEFQEAIREAGFEDRVEHVDRGDTARFEVPAARTR